MKTKKVYKLFRLVKGNLKPLFIDRNKTIELGTWYKAEDHKTEGYAHRPGWHCSTEPKAPHLSMKGRVWCECEIPDKKFHPVAILREPLEEDKIGYYVFPRPKNQGGEWLIATDIKVNKIL